MRKILSFLTAIMIGVNAFGQQHHIEFPTNEFQVKENNFYSYNYTIHLFPYERPTRLDTLNNCRVRRNKIKSVTIYQFYSATDSLEITKIEYDSAGLTPFMRMVFSAGDIKLTDCDSVFPQRNPANKTIRKRNDRFREKWTTDNHGYITSYTRINKGLFNRWIMNHWMGLPDEKIIYTYDSLHLSVAETVYPVEWINFKNPKAYNYRYEYRMDNKGDLLSEFRYEKNGNGEMVLVSGYTYHYEYY